MKTHPATDIFPMMSDEELTALAADIKENGLREPVITHQGLILDGRNRSKACELAGITLKVKEWDGNGSPTAFVISLNLHRRHLTQSQKAAVAVEVLPLLEEEAKKRQGRRTDLVQEGQSLFDNFGPKIDQSFGRSREQASEIMGVTPSYIADAKRIKQEAPDLFESVKTGEMKMTEAKRQVRQREMKDAPPPPVGKYTVIYADPPWSYGNSGAIGENDNYGHVERHYPAMPITDICALPIRDIANEDAALFLWVTSPLLEDAFQVIRAWGFKYKTSFVWDKVKHNFGYYNSVRHELLLVCTRGSCLPEVRELHDSVVSIERSSTHSEKPEYFRSLIASLYPSASKVELFARKASEGWSVWGNQV